MVWCDDLGFMFIAGPGNRPSVAMYVDGVNTKETRQVESFGEHTQIIFHKVSKRQLPCAGNIKFK
jgi:hypothetical protein